MKRTNQLLLEVINYRVSDKRKLLDIFEAEGNETLKNMYIGELAALSEVICLLTSEEFFTNMVRRMEEDND